MPSFLLRLFSAVLVGFCLATAPAAQADLYVAPVAQGSADGSSATNAAGYLDRPFWSGAVQSAQAAADLNVWFANGNYTAGTLMLQNQGDPRHVCTLRAATDGGVTLQADGKTNILWLRGTQNVALRGFRFTGKSTQGAVNLSYYPGPTKTPTRMIRIENCWFEHLTALAYGAILFGGNRDVTIEGCHFYRITGPNPPAVHGVYVGRSSQNITVRNCDFTDIGGEYVRFRDDSEYAIVDHCVFHSTEDGCNQPFIGVPCYNSRGPCADEFFGGHFQFTNNQYRYDTTGGRYRYAHYFYNSGYDICPGENLRYSISTGQAAILNGGTPAKQNAILAPQMGLDNANIKIYGNTYSGVMAGTAYRAYSGYGAVAPFDSSNSPVNISQWPGDSGTFAPAPLLRNGGFEEPGNRRRGWYLFAGQSPGDHAGLGGSSRAIQLDRSSPTEFGQWLRGPLTSVVTVHCLFAVGATSGSGIKFQVQLYHNEVTNSYLAFAVDGSGALGYVDQGAFVAIPVLGKIEFSADANRPTFYQLRIAADYSGAEPSYTFARGVPNRADDYSFTSGPIKSWVGAAPVPGSTLGLLNFTNSGADVVVDECR